MNKNTKLAPVISRIQIVYATDVSSVESVTANLMAVTLKSGASYTDIYTTPGSAEYTEPTKDSAAGLLYQQKLTAQFPGSQEDNLSVLDDLNRRFLLVKFSYTDGTVRFIGSTTNPARAIAEYSTSKGGWSLSFTCTARKPAFWLP